MTSGRENPLVVRGARWVFVLFIGCSGDPSAGPAEAPSLAPRTGSADELCGGVDGACCSPPRAPCSRGLHCDEASVCRLDESSAADAPMLCSEDADCMAGRRCCEAGLQGTCEAIDRAAACPLPDLAVLASGAGATVSEEVFEGVRPSAGGCVRERGPRRRLRVSAAVANLGQADFIFGSRDALLIDNVSASDEFVRYSLIDAAGETVATSHGQLPCREDVDASLPFSCAFAGLPAGALLPTMGLECEALDVTDLPPGGYRVRIELALVWPDADPSNGRVELPVDLPSFNPVDPCPPVENPLQGLGTYRECGWLPGALPGDGTCNPGELVLLDCGRCTASPVLRLCAGDESCSAASSLAQTSGYSETATGAFAEPCSGIQATCPRSGRYNVLIGSEDPFAMGPSCTLTPSSWSF